MPKPIEEIDPKTADLVWRIAGSITWTVEDWKTFYFAVTRAFLEIAYRHAKEKIADLKIIENSERIVVDSSDGR